MRRNHLLALFAGLLLAGCSGTEVASFTVDAEHSVTVMVYQDWPWSERQLDVVVQGLPDCQRRYPLTALGASKKAMPLHRFDENQYAMRVGKKPYLFDVKTCEVTLFNEIPGLTDDNLEGRFTWMQGEFGFIPAKK